MSVLADDVAAHDWSVAGAEKICGKPGRSMATLTWQRHICTSAARGGSRAGEEERDFEICEVGNVITRYRS